jgi:hypothetical protein
MCTKFWLESLKRKYHSLGRPRHGLEDNIKMDLMEIGWESVEWIHMAGRRRVASSCETSGSIKGGKFIG